jgi:hypothetical protein
MQKFVKSSSAAATFFENKKSYNPAENVRGYKHFLNNSRDTSEPHPPPLEVVTIPFVCRMITVWETMGIIFSPFSESFRHLQITFTGKSCR